MQVLNGVGISKGIFFGKIHFYNRKLQNIEKCGISDIQSEIKRFDDAREIARGELQVLYERAISSVGQEHALIFGVHQMMLEDAQFLEAVYGMIREEQVNAEYAVETVAREQEEQLRKQKRDADMRDVAERLLRILRNAEEVEFIENAKTVLVAEDLLPSEMLRLKEKHIGGIVLLKGNANSHVAIFAKSMEIPLLIQGEKDWVESYIGKQVAIDGETGKLYIEPQAEIVHQLQEKLKIGISEVGKIKTKLCISANVGSFEEARKAVQYGADAIGLVRSEIFCLGEGRILSEEEQVKIYRKLVEIMKGKKIVIRTWDFGEDKKLIDDASTSRGIQWCFEHEEIFREQLRAIGRISEYGEVAVLFPMIDSPKELRQAKQILTKVKEELAKEGIPFDEDIKIGVMLETPAAIINSRELAKEVDFCSIGTNDLIQYTFGINRQQSYSQGVYKECYPTLIQMLRMAITNVHIEGKTIGICGELGADTQWTEKFVKLGIDELSMAPSSILEVRKKVIEIE